LRLVFKEGEGKPTMKILDGATGSRIEETEATTTPLALLTYLVSRPI